jgi:hypothetical protein
MMNLKMFKALRKEGPVRVAWFDDKPKNVREIVTELTVRGIKTKLFDEPEELYQEVDLKFDQPGPRIVPDVLITDLLIEKAKYKKTPNYDGVEVGNTIMGKYHINLNVPARIGIASYWPKLIQKAPRHIFGFDYHTPTLIPTTGSLFDNFFKVILRCALDLWVDCWCMGYMEQNPIKEYNDRERYVPGEPAQQFGYINRHEGAYSVVWLWNPQKIRSGKTCLIDRKFLEVRGIEEEQQPFRVVNIMDLKQPNTTIRVIEPLSGPKEFQFLKII